MKNTNIAAPDYFHKVVDCQWACPAHTPVPEYIRMIAAGRYSDAYMLNWRSNVFPEFSDALATAPVSQPAGVCAWRRSRWLFAA
jgi:NADPH-dependent glutamate synthase beta subunit-like oxidoreductase